MSQKLSNWASVAEIIGAIAIVVSLLFVGVELRYSNTLAATESLRVGTQAWVGEYKRVFDSEDSTAFMRRALHSYEDLSQDEKGRFFGSMMGFVSAFDTIYNQYQAGLLREDVFVSIALGYYGLVGTPGAQQALQNTTQLPRYLLDYSVNDVLIGYEDDLAESYSFLREQQ